MLRKWKKVVLYICLICALKDMFWLKMILRFFIVLLEVKVMLFRVRIWLDIIFLRFLGSSIIILVLFEFRSRKLDF